MIDQNEYEEIVSDSENVVVQKQNKYDMQQFGKTNEDELMIKERRKLLREIKELEAMLRNKKNELKVNIFKALEKDSSNIKAS